MIGSQSSAPPVFGHFFSKKLRWVRFAPLFALGLSLSCSQPDAGELQQWTPADHDHQGAAATGQVDTSKKRPGMPDLEKQGVNDVVLATWKQNCIACHGVIGRGDGPQSKSTRPPDLTNPQWQKNAIDSELRFSIKKGKGGMPAFAHLPDKTVDGLVQLIRMLNSSRPTSKPAKTTDIKTETETEAEAKTKTSGNALE